MDNRSAKSDVSKSAEVTGGEALGEKGWAESG